MQNHLARGRAWVGLSRRATGGSARPAASNNFPLSSARPEVNPAHAPSQLRPKSSASRFGGSADVNAKQFKQGNDGGKSKSNKHGSRMSLSAALLASLIGVAGWTFTPWNNSHMAEATPRLPTAPKIPESHPHETPEDNSKPEAKSTIHTNGNGNGRSSNIQTVSVSVTRGPRPAMEDEHFVDSSKSFFGVYDGHGGKWVSKVTHDWLFEYFSEHLETARARDRELASTAASTNNKSEEIEPAVAYAFRRAFEDVSDRVLADPALDMQGSTAVAVYLDGDDIWCANIGDSRAIMSRGNQSLELSIDHKPNDPSEIARIEALGGHVRWYGYLSPSRKPIPGMGAYRINGNLAVSRALGDKMERPFVSSEPDIKRFTRSTQDDYFIILASDGLWDVMTSEDAVMFVSQILSGSVGALQEGGQGGSAGAEGQGSSEADSGVGGDMDDEGYGSGGGMRPVSRRLSQWMKGYKGDRGMLRAVIENRKHKMAQYLVEESIRRGTTDNVTVVVVWLR